MRQPRSLCARAPPAACAPATRAARPAGARLGAAAGGPDQTWQPQPQIRNLQCPDLWCHDAEPTGHARPPGSTWPLPPSSCDGTVATTPAAPSTCEYCSPARAQTRRRQLAGPPPLPNSAGPPGPGARQRGKGASGRHVRQAGGRARAPPGTKPYATLTLTRQAGRPVRARLDDLVQRLEVLVAEREDHPARVRVLPPALHGRLAHARHLRPPAAVAPAPRLPAGRGPHAKACRRACPRWPGARRSQGTASWRGNLRA